MNTTEQLRRNEARQAEAVNNTEVQIAQVERAILTPKDRSNIMRGLRTKLNRQKDALATTRIHLSIMEQDAQLTIPEVEEIKEKTDTEHDGEVDLPHLRRKR